MSDKDKHITPYSSQDIEKYLRGELSAPEMHALERAALDDPFLADALEGMDLHRQLPEQPSFRGDMAELEGRLQERVAVKKRGRVFPLLMRYAAAVLLLVGLGFTVYYMLPGKNKINANVATMRQMPAAPSVVAKPDTSFEKALAKTEPATGATNVHKQVEDLSRPLAEARKRMDQKVRRDEVASASRWVQAEKEVKEKVLPVADGKSVILIDSLPASSYALQPNDPKPNAASYNLKRKAAEIQAFSASKPLSAPLVISGKVIDQNNHPLSGAFLALKNNAHVNAVTDKNGDFNLRLNSKLDTTSTVVVNSVGFEQVSMLLNTENRKGNVIQLQPQQASLNEVVIEGYGSRRREIMRQNIDARQKELSLVAVPADGWAAYKDYLEIKKRSVIIDSTFRGTETISFNVNKKGELSSFKVEQSISPAHDSATIDMIKQGPAWKLVSGKKARARVILNY